MITFTINILFFVSLTHITTCSKLITNTEIDCRHRFRGKKYLYFSKLHSTHTVLNADLTEYCWGTLRNFLPETYPCVSSSEVL